MYMFCFGFDEAISSKDNDQVSRSSVPVSLISEIQSELSRAEDPSLGFRLLKLS